MPRPGAAAASPTIAALDRTEWNRTPGRGRLPRAALAGAVGPRRVAGRAARHRRGAAAAAGPPTAPAGRGLGAADARSATARPSSRSAGSRRRCAARSPGARCSASPAPAATWRRSRPRGDDGSTAAGRSPARRCGPRWPTRRDWAICLARTDPDAPRHDGIGCFIVDMTTAGHRHPTAARADRHGDVQRGVPRRRVRARRLRGRRADRGVGVRPHHARQRAGVDGVGLVVRPGRAGAVRPGRPRRERLDDADSVVRPARRPAGRPSHAVAMLGVRTTLRALGGGAARARRRASASCSASSTSSACRRSASTLLGPGGAVDEGDGATWTGGFLGNRACRSPAAPARSSATSSPSACSASPGRVVGLSRSQVETSSRLSSSSPISRSTASVGL